MPERDKTLVASVVPIVEHREWGGGIPRAGETKNNMEILWAIKKNEECPFLPCLSSEGHQLTFQSGHSINVVD